MTSEGTLQEYQQARLLHALRQIFGHFDHTMLLELMPQLEWVQIAGGETLFRENEVGDDLYFVIGGRLRAHVAEPDGGRRLIGEIVRGETAGEMAVIANEPRSATVTAIRDSVLVRLSRETFGAVIKAYPTVAMNITRLIIERLKRSARLRADIKRPVNICVVPVSDGVDMPAFCAALLPQLSRAGGVIMLDSATVMRDHAAALEPSAAAGTDADRVLTHWLDEIESTHEFLVFVADPVATPWTRRCFRHADEILLLARADRPPALHPVEVELTGFADGITGTTQQLVLLHHKATRLPHGTAAWLDRRPVHGHVHLRDGEPGDIARLARILNGSAIGLVFSGGGARGFAHLGVYKALEEYGIPIDFVGGTSIGSAMGGLVALDLTAAEAIDNARRAFGTNPTSDFNLLPLVSLIGGRKLRNVIDAAIINTVGFDPDISDTWKNFYCVASNFSLAREEVMSRGAMSKAIRASVSIPGALPPVIFDGALLLDGGTFNNFPTDIMAQRGMGRIIGVDLMRTRHRRLDMDELPGNLALLRDRFRSPKRRKYRLPSPFSTLLQVSILTSMSRQKHDRAVTDLYLNPDLGRVGMLEWKAFDRIVRIGYEHAREALDAMTAEELAAYRG
jgi:NTE family protein